VLGPDVLPAGPEAELHGRADAHGIAFEARVDTGLHLLKHLMHGNLRSADQAKRDGPETPSAPGPLIDGVSLR
jgi:hypothetical protein